MDVCKSASPVSPDELVAESNAAASNLHNALVVLRNELVLKNKRIEELERQIGIDAFLHRCGVHCGLVPSVKRRLHR